MSTIQELGAFLAREQAAGTTPAQASTTPANEPAAPASFTGSAVELPATEAGFNTDYNRAPAARP